VFGFRDVLSAPIPMPVLTEPSLGPIVSGKYTADAVIDTDLHVDAFEIENNAVVTIQGNVTILSEGPAKIVTGGRLYIPAGSSLDLYLKSSMLVTTDGSDTPSNLYNGNNGMSGDPAKLRIYQLSAETIELSSNNGRMAAHVVAPQGTLFIRQDATFRGTFIGRVLQLEQNALFMEDKSSPVVVIGGSPGDSAGAAGPADNGGITDSVTFSQWFRDVLGQNLSSAHTITLTRDAGGVYEYLDDAFYPIDGMLFGNAGEPRNNYFTYTIKAEFTYQSCAGQFVEFTGADDLWLFINGELAMDAGGVVPMVAQYLDLDRLGLADGATHRLELFYAHRQPISSVFRLRTDLVLSSTAPTTVSYAGD
ncbi:MAG: fibro-slime domain-containing protein, partial [Gemmatimonadales bacterium]